MRDDKFYLLLWLPHDLSDPRWKAIADRRLRGLKGISGSHLILRFRGQVNTLIVMDRKKVLRYNDAEAILYDNPEYLFRDGAIALRRLYMVDANHTWSLLFRTLFEPVFQTFEIPFINASTMRSAWTDVAFNAKREINSSEDFVRRAEKHVLTWSGDNHKRALSDEDQERVKDFFDRHLSRMISIVESKATRIARQYAWEHEWKVNSDTFIIPKGSKLYLPNEAFIELETYAKGLYQAWVNLGRPEPEELFALREQNPDQAPLYEEMYAYSYTLEDWDAILDGIESFGLRDKYQVNFLSTSKLKAAAEKLDRKAY